MQKDEKKMHDSFENTSDAFMQIAVAFMCVLKGSICVGTVMMYVETVKNRRIRMTTLQNLTPSTASFLTNKPLNFYKRFYLCHIFYNTSSLRRANFEF